MYRSLICIGLVKINWKTLTPKIFEFTANCDTNGTFLTVQARKIVTDEEEQMKKVNEKEEKSTVDTETEEKECHKEELKFDLKETLHQDLTSKIKMFVWKGYAYIALGVLINLPWMYLLYIMKRNMAYNP